MNNTRPPSADASGPVPETADRPRLTCDNQRTCGPTWKLHALMFAVGLVLLLVAHWMQSLNSELRAPNGDAFFSTADRVRVLLRDDVNAAGAALLGLSATGLILTWCQARWPRALEDRVSRAWRRRHRLAPPAADRRWSRKYALLTCGFLYAWALGFAIVPTVLAFHLVPNLYNRVPAASATGAARAPQLIDHSTRVLSLVVSTTYVVFMAGVYGARTWSLRKTESWLDRGVPVCLACGYPLRGLDSPACPECGAPWSQWYPSKDGRPVLPE